MEKVRLTRPPINWLKLLLVGVWLFLGLALIEIAVLPPQLEWLEWGKWLLRMLFVVLAGLVILVEILPHLSKRKCASCGAVVYQYVANCDPCPHCDRPFEDMTNLMPQEGALRIREYLSDSRPTAKIVGLILALAIRDGCNQVRFVGGDGDYPEAPPDASHRLWRIWLHLKGAAYEAVPPPSHLGADIFRLLKEIHRRAPKEAAEGSASFHIAIDDYSEAVELAIEESDEEAVARIVFTSETPEPWAGGERFLQEYFASRCSDTLECAADGSCV